ncbi:hypothetical protein JCM3765_001733 [Sporobolomyces pararoseus]
MSDTITLPAEWECLSSTRFPEIKVWVTIDGKPVATHKKDTMNQASVSAEIVGIEGKEFKVHFFDGRTKLTKPFVHRLYLDGKWACGYYEKKDSTTYSAPQDSIRRLTTFEATTAPGYEKPFVFGKVATTDNPAKATKSDKILSQVGTIEIEYRRIKGLKITSIPPSPPRARASSSVAAAAIATQPNSQNLIDEKLKKAQFGLSTGVGQARPVGHSLGGVGGSSTSALQPPPPPPRKSKEKVDYKFVDDDTPFITYTFRVRSSSEFKLFVSRFVLEKVYSNSCRPVVGIQDELFADEPVAGGSGTSKRSSASYGNDDDDEDEDLDEEALDAKLKALEERKARLEAKRAKTSKPDIKPSVSPSPPFDWQGRPPIELGNRIYVDCDEATAQMMEEAQLEKRKDGRSSEEEKRSRALRCSSSPLSSRSLIGTNLSPCGTWYPSEI